jgi:hypothetical protein
MRDLYRLLYEKLPRMDRVLVAKGAILLYLNQFGVTRWSKRPVTWTTLRQ